MFFSRLGFLILFLILFGFYRQAQAEFVISSAIVEFTKDGSSQQDIELVSRSKDKDYIVSEISEVLNPGTPDETRKIIDDPEQSRLLVTPDKTILTSGGSRVLRFVLLKDLDQSEHIYRVAIKPVIKGIENKTKVGLKILIGYEVLVIMRPANAEPSFTAQRDGKIFTVINKGNTNILFENGTQCKSDETCPMPPVLRAYAGQTTSITLPKDQAVDYMVWDGSVTDQRHFD